MKTPEETGTGCRGIEGRSHLGGSLVRTRLGALVPLAVPVNSPVCNRAIPVCNQAVPVLLLVVEKGDPVESPVRTRSDLEAPALV